MALGMFTDCLTGRFDYEAIPPHPRKSRSSIRPSLPLVCVILTLSNIVALSIIYALANSTPSVDLSGNRARRTPFMSEIDRSLHVHTFVGWESKPNKYTISAAKAGKAVDKAWAELGAYEDSVLVPQEEAQAFDIDVGRHLRVSQNDSWAAPLPYDGFPALINAFHLLHCVNFLRQGLYYNVDFYRKTGHVSMNGTSEELEVHLGHCVDALRQMIMCQSDDSVVPWMKSNDLGMKSLPDFARPKMCRDFGALKRWNDAHLWRTKDGRVPSGLERT
ncbi:Cyclochlorotine biosynthesis protein O [Pseudocercospora fuligena]|uniref:Cyclochlorotine biosynthesis protein O n=1 Tax=Pseudocercospora fuligena TaxID=685502 RepID=A0A8H6RN42_9PEZI|nr:Cyclochlorotine biosynthesis protein O [Pseudocercospora fuligena]